MSSCVERGLEDKGINEQVALKGKWKWGLWVIPFCARDSLAGQFWGSGMSQIVLQSK
jgi:hypothetical protein